MILSGSLFSRGKIAHYPFNVSLHDVLLLICEFWWDFSETNRVLRYFCPDISVKRAHLMLFKSDSTLFLFFLSSVAMDSLWPPLFGIFGAFFIVYFKVIRATIYDFVITKMTSVWYRAVLEGIPDNSRVLDVGIGTGASLLANKDIIKRKNLTFVGVDYDDDYVERCQSLIKSNSMQSSITVFSQSFYDFGKVGLTAKQAPFDVVYFSGSLMIMPDPVGALAHAVSLLKDRKKNCVYTTQTFEQTKNPLMEVIKPLLKFITTIDFGRVTYEKDFHESVRLAGMRIVSDTTMNAEGISGTVSSKGSRDFHCIKLQTI